MRSKQTVLLTCFVVVLAAGDPSLMIPSSDAEAADGYGSVADVSRYDSNAGDRHPLPSTEFDAGPKCDRGSQRGTREEAANDAFDSCASFAVSAFDGSPAPEVGGFQPQAQAMHADSEPAVKGQSLELASPDPKGTSDPARSPSAGGESHGVEDVACATDIFLAVYFKSSLSSTGTLLVAATNSNESGANLELVGYGRMNRHRQSELWVIRIRNLEANPGIAKVESADCVVLAPVLTVPSAFDEKLLAAWQEAQD